MGNDSRESELVLAADIGGTNTNLALIRGGRTLFSRRYPTGREASAEDALSLFLNEARTAGMEKPSLACVCGAGPVSGSSLAMSNAPWKLELDSLKRALGLPCYLLNDFSAVAWGILTLQPGDSKALTQLPRPDGVLWPPAQTGTILALGAGTGLGCGFISRDRGVPSVHPSEGGHMHLPVYDEASARLALWLARRYDAPVGAEAAVSGLGIGNILAWLVSEAGGASESLVAILQAAPNEQARLVSEAAGCESLCDQALDLFVDLYARVASSLALAFMPTGGLYLAGGIAAKNADRFASGSRFMRGFLSSYKEHTRRILEEIPVFILNDYDISLAGAAYAARILSAQEAAS